MITKKGYERVWRNGKKVYLHRWVWEQIFGPLPRGWDVHHIDGNKTGPHLVAMPRTDHDALHAKERKKLDI